MRTRTTAALIVVVLLAATGIEYVVHRHGSHGSVRARAGAAPAPAASSSRPPVLATPSASRAAGRTGVEKVLRGPFAAGGLGHGVAGVVESSSGGVLFDRLGSRGEPPASTTKLMTASAALTALGPDARLTTRVVRLGHTIWLVGGGDVTLTKTPEPSTYPEPAALSTLAHETASALSGVGSVRLRLDTSAWSGPTRAVGWESDYVGEGDITPPAALELDEGRLAPGLEVGARVTDPVTQAGQAFLALLRADHLRVTGSVRRQTAPASATSLASVSSPTIAALVQRMLTNSDDDLAEALGRAVARHENLPGSFVGAAQAVTKTVASLGVATAGLRLHDTSGLSRSDRIPPVDLASMLRLDASSSHLALRAVLEGLPIAGFTGTLAPRYRMGSARSGAGVIRAKTGTLNGISTLAGMVLDRSGQLLVFAFMASHAPDTGAAEQALDVAASRLAGCGCES